MADDARALWDDIYADGQQMNKAPFDEVISFVYRNQPDKDPHQIRILEVGCGVGNNIKHFAREGYKCSGIDGSHDAVQLACEGMARIPSYEVFQGDFRTLPWGMHSFDLVIDRAALWYVDRIGARRALSEIHRVMNTGGRLLFTPCRKNIDHRTGTIRFDTAKQAMALLSEERWKIISFDRVDIWDISKGYKIRSSHFRIVAEKK